MRLLPKASNYTGPLNKLHHNFKYLPSYDLCIKTSVLISNLSPTNIYLGSKAANHSTHRHTYQPITCQNAGGKKHVMEILGDTTNFVSSYVIINAYSQQKTLRIKINQFHPLKIALY